MCGLSLFTAIGLGQSGAVKITDDVIDHLTSTFYLTDSEWLLFPYLTIKVFLLKVIASFSQPNACGRNQHSFICTTMRLYTCPEDRTNKMLRI